MTSAAPVPPPLDEYQKYEIECRRCRAMGVPPPIMPPPKVSPAPPPTRDVLATRVDNLEQLVASMNRTAIKDKTINKPRLTR